MAGEHLEFGLDQGVVQRPVRGAPQRPFQGLVRCREGGAGGLFRHRVLFRPAAGVGDARRGQGMSTQEFEQGVFRQAAGPQHALEETRHVPRIVTGGGQDLQADAVRFPLVAAGEIDLALDAAGAGGGQGRTAQLGVLGPQQHGGDDGGGHGQAHLAGGLHGAGDVALGDVGDFVGQHGGQFSFRFREGDEPAVDADMAAWACEGIDHLRVHHEEVEFTPAVFAAGHQAVAQVLEIVRDLRIFHQMQGAAQGAHEGLPQGAFLFAGEVGLGAGTHLRQAHGLARRGA